MHVPERDEALRRMISAVRPGGWLLVEDYDVNLQPLICPDEVTPDHQLANRVKAGFRQLLLDRGADIERGRRLPRMFRAAGLTQVGADAYFPLAVPAVAASVRANVHQFRDALIARGEVVAADIDRAPSRSQLFADARHAADERSGAMYLRHPHLDTAAHHARQIW